MTKLKTKNTIITVDDFGYNHKANQLVFEAVEKTMIHLVSIMVNMNESPEALAYMTKIQNSKFQEVKFGLHLNLTEGKPLSDSGQIPSLMGKNGQFLGWQGLIKRALSGQLRAQDIERETRAQIEKFQTIAKPVPFLNSHHHIHLWPQIAKVILPLCREYGINQIRWPRRIWWQSILTKHGLKALTIQLIGAVGYYLLPETSQLATSQYFFDLDWLSQGNIQDIINQLPANTELSCHPLNYQMDTVENSTLMWLNKV